MAGPLALEDSAMPDPLAFCVLAVKPVVMACRSTRRAVLPDSGGTSRSSITNMKVSDADALAMEAGRAREGAVDVAADRVRSRVERGKI
jgi:hypothetical protein